MNDHVASTAPLAVSIPRRHLPLRSRLLLASALVQLIMLGLLIYNGIAVLEDKLTTRARIHLEDQKQLLSAVITVPLILGEEQRVQQVLDRVRRGREIVYMVLHDREGDVIAASGWNPRQPLPPREAAFTLDDDIFHTEVDVQIGDENYGKLAIGLDTRYLKTARSELIRDDLAVGVLLLLLSSALTVGVAYWLKRSLSELTHASTQIARGDLSVRLAARGNDEVAQLTKAFNVMAAALKNRIDALAESEAKFTAIADYSYDCELWISPRGKLVWINPRVHDMFGYTPDECIAMADFPAPCVAQVDAGRTMREIRKALRGNTGQDFEFRGRRKDQSEFWAAADWRAIYDKAGGYQGIRISIRDIAQHKEAEQRLEATVVELRSAQEVQKDYLARAENEHARLSALLGAMQTGILFVSDDNRVVYSNPAFHRICPFPSDLRIIGSTPEALAEASGFVLPSDDSVRRLLHRPREGEPSGVYELQTLDGRLVTQEGHAVQDSLGRHVGYLWLFEDVTRERQTAEQLVYLAERDALTGLYNRHRFNEELARMIADAQRHASRLALLFFDLDDFKYINDTFGHRAGDAMLIRVAGEIAGQVRRNELLSRLGGDEFAILVPDISDEMLRALAERITRSIATVRLQFEGEHLRLTTSVGIAVYPDHSDNAEDLIARADIAMYQAKEAGKNAWRVYRSELDTSLQMVSRMSWNDRILHALENNLMTLQFQGIYSTADLALSHFEVLVRMRDKDDPSVIFMPAQFIPVAEKSGTIIDLDRWVLRHAIELLGQRTSLPGLAVNISGRSFDDPTLPQFIATQLKRCGVSPERLMVELTETAAVSDLHDAQRFIEALRQTGCRVCLDDFGTGFSSFAYLKHLHADALKIDGLFIRNLPQELDNQLFVKAMVSVARGLHKSIIAECVEDEATLQMLREFNVEFVQGYHMDKPLGDHPLMQVVEARGNMELPLTVVSHA
ncbi:MAG TPA: EAL domain-containing protein [Burkholderiales bacterium]|nr:EAL domain-containing protein [Burkholderiales bacterium]